MFDRVLNTPLPEIYQRKKEENNYFPGGKVCLVYAYFFTDSISVVLIKNHAYFTPFSSICIVDFD